MPELTNERIANWRCDVCGQKRMRRTRRPYEYDISHEGRPPVRIHIPDLEVIAGRLLGGQATDHPHFLLFPGKPGFAIEALGADLGVAAIPCEGDWPDLLRALGVPVLGSVTHLLSPDGRWRERIQLAAVCASISAKGRSFRLMQ